MESLRSPTARALRTLELLQVRPGITADEIADRLAVTDRAARRYIEILREADIPIESSRGPYGGYRLGRGVRLPPLVFSAGEALGLVMAVLDGHHAAADPLDPVGSALGKLIRSLPENVGRAAATMRQHALAAPDRRAARPDPVITSALVDAIASQRRVRIFYRPERGARMETEADPWAIVIRHGRWYLLCFAHRAGGERAYRIDRIENLEQLQADSQPPPDLDPIARLEQHLGSGWKHETHVIFEAPISTVARFVPPPMGRLEPIDEGSRTALRGTTNNPTMYAGEWLASIPLPFTVLGGPELREAVAAIARRMAAAAGLNPLPDSSAESENA
ncbi:MAG TPA: WYL domain-containing protein [Acidimicrobiia bacterium]|nr:WYL domain-containing protein [Acidimicrobiia bacterium]